MELVGGWGFQQGRWLASMAGEMLELSMEQHGELERLLREQGIVTAFHPGFLLSFLCHCTLPQMLFWTVEAMSVIAQLIHWYQQAIE